MSENDTPPPEPLRSRVFRAFLWAMIGCIVMAILWGLASTSNAAAGKFAGDFGPKTWIILVLSMLFLSFGHEFRLFDPPGSNKPKPHTP